MLFCEALELLLNRLNFDLHLFRSEERKGIRKVMRIFIRNFTIFLLSNVVWFNGVGNAEHRSVVGSWLNVDEARGCWVR